MANGAPAEHNEVYKDALSRAPAEAPKEAADVMQGAMAEKRVALNENVAQSLQSKAGEPQAESVDGWKVRKEIRMRRVALARNILNSIQTEQNERKAA